MRRIATTAAALALATQAQAAGPPRDAVKVDQNGSTRTLDCAGRDLIVTGDNNRLTATACLTISVVGNHNQLSARLLPESTIAALGNANHIVFVHAPGFEVQVTSTGAGNEIVPLMGRDLHAASPAPPTDH